MSGDMRDCQAVNATQPEGSALMGAIHQARRSLLSADQGSTPIALSPLRGQNPREEPGALAALAGIWPGGRGAILVYRDPVFRTEKRGARRPAGPTPGS
jgi:hypothetical protein